MKQQTSARLMIVFVSLALLALSCGSAAEVGREVGQASGSDLSLIHI